MANGSVSLDECLQPRDLIVWSACEACIALHGKILVSSVAMLVSEFQGLHCKEVDGGESKTASRASSATTSEIGSFYSAAGKFCGIFCPEVDCGLITDDNTLSAPVFPDAGSPTQPRHEVHGHFGFASSMELALAEHSRNTRGTPPPQESRTTTPLALTEQSRNTTLSHQDSRNTTLSHQTDWCAIHCATSKLCLKVPECTGPSVPFSSLELLDEFEKGDTFSDGSDTAWTLAAASPMSVHDSVWATNPDRRSVLFSSLTDCQLGDTLVSEGTDTPCIATPISLAPTPDCSECSSPRSNTKRLCLAARALAAQDEEVSRPCEIGTEMLFWQEELRMVSVSSPSACSSCWSFNSESGTRSPISLPYGCACAHARVSPLSCGPTASTTSNVQRPVVLWPSFSSTQSDVVGSLSLC
jgi:hypothetical protein